MLSNAQLIFDYIYFKKSKGASQSQYVILSETNFEDLTRGRWGLITKRDVDAWTSEGGKTVVEVFFEVFLYIHRRALCENAVPTG